MYLEQAKSISRKAKFLDSYEKRLVNEFKLTLLYAGNVQVFLRGALCAMFLGVAYFLIHLGKCFFHLTFH